MSMQDPIADCLTRIRNAQLAGKFEVSMPLSRLKKEICSVLVDEGYLSNIEVSGDEKKPVLSVGLKYFQGKPVIEHLKRVSSPGSRVFKAKDQIPRVNNGLGIAILSTNKGIISDRTAKELGVGGEIICTVS